MTDEQLLASVMRKVLLSEDMYVQDDDRLLLDGHVHGGITSGELEAVRRVLAEREEWKSTFEPIQSMPQQMEVDTFKLDTRLRRLEALEQQRQQRQRDAEDEGSGHYASLRKRRDR